MVDVVSRRKRSQMMAGIKGKNTKPEILVRKGLFRQGFRYSLHGKALPGRPDIVLQKHKAVVFVHGCFWHGHDDCRLFRLPKSRKNFWQTKIGSNIARDERNVQELEKAGWRICRIWECAVKGKPAAHTEKMLQKAGRWIRSGKKFLEIRE